MHYAKITFTVADQDTKDIMVAELADAGYSGFEEQDDLLIAYIDASKFTEAELDVIAGLHGVQYEYEDVPQQNWNAVWESNFQPVVVDGFCTIRAHFHEIIVNTPYEIVITPKMSFGTGHHATTQLMMTMMRDMELEGKTVLDFGTGTGVLAILAEMLGARSIVAIDNDEWSVENAEENLVRNGCKNITISGGSLEDVASPNVDVILANINRHILLHYMADMYKKVADDGKILMSGLLTEDRSVINEAAADAGFRLVAEREQNNWIALMFDKG